MRSRLIFISVIAGAALLSFGVGRWSSRPEIPAGFVDFSKAPPAMLEAFKKPEVFETEIKSWVEREAHRLEWRALQESVPNVVLPAGVPPPPSIRLKQPGANARWPDLALVRGDAQRLQSARSDWVVINLWASWCAPCVAELSDLDMAYNNLRAAGIELAVINADPSGEDTEETVAALFKKHGVTHLDGYHVNGSVDALKFLEAFDFPGGAITYPATMIFSPDGKPYALITGGQVDEKVWSTRQMRRFLTALAEQDL